MTCFFNDGRKAFEAPLISFEEKCTYHMSGENGSGKTTYFKNYIQQRTDSIYLGQDYLKYIFDWKNVLHFYYLNKYRFED